MKYIFPITFLSSLILNQKIVAQDIIKFKNGDESKVKVQEITPQEIKYKRFASLNGPLMTVLKTTVSSIRYENGVVEKLAEDKPPVVPIVPNSYAGSTTQPDALANADGFGIGDMVTTEYYGPTYSGKVVGVNRDKLTALLFPMPHSPRI